MAASNSCGGSEHSRFVPTQICTLLDEVEQNEKSFSGVRLN